MEKNELEIKLAAYMHIVNDIKGHLMDLDEMESREKYPRVVGMITADVSNDSIKNQIFLCSTNAEYRNIIN